MIIDGKGQTLGRLASFVAKRALKGEEVVILNCDKVIISGNRKNIEKEFEEKRARIGSSQKGPKHPRDSEKILKRAIRGMLPDHREGKGRIAFKKIKCYKKTPKEFEGKKTFDIKEQKKIKFIELNKLNKKNDR